MKPVTYMLLLSVLLTVGCDKKPAKTAEGHPMPDAVERSAPSKPAPEPADEAVGQRWKASDVHTHLSPRSYPLAIELMDQNELYRMVNMSGGSSPAYREKHIELADEYPGRIALFANPDWSRAEAEDFGEQMAAELEKAVALGYTGLKISKALGLGVKGADGELMPVDAEKLDPMWAKAGELGVPVGIHTSDPKAFFEKPGPDNERWEELKEAPSWSFYGDEYPSREALLAQRDRMIAKHPETTFMLLHFGNNPEDIDYVEQLLEKYPNVILDVAARIGEIGRHDPEKVRQLFIEHQDRILFATDLGVRVQRSPQGMRYALTLGSLSKEPPTLEDVADFYQDHWRYFESDEEAIEHPVPIQGDWKVHPIDLPQEVLDKLYWKNAERIIFAPWQGRRAAHSVAQKARNFSGQ